MRKKKMSSKKDTICIIVGHTINGKDKGAVAYDGTNESAFNDGVAKKIKAYFEEHKVNCDIEIFYRDNQTFVQIGKKMAELEPLLSIELHFNAFSKPAYGCECLALANDKKSSDFAKDIMKEFEKKFNIKRRGQAGLLPIGVGGRGFNNLNLVRKEFNSKLLTNIPVVLIEPFFANFKTKESEPFISTKGHDYAMFLCDYFISKFDLNLVPEIEVTEEYTQDLSDIDVLPLPPVPLPPRANKVIKFLKWLQDIIIRMFSN
jgi:hypothetical protein